MSLWRQNTELLIKDNMGEVREDFSADTSCSNSFVILPSSNKGSDQLVSQIKAFIHMHSVTESQFNSLKLCEERQLRKSLAEAGNEDYAEQYKVLRDVFKMFIQNDASVFCLDAATLQDQESPEACLAAIKTSVAEGASCETVLDAFRSSRGQTACQALNMLLLEDVILYVAEEELEPLVEELCCLTGATKTDTVTPCLTTHIVCSRETP